MSVIANAREWYKNEDGATDVDFIRAHEDMTPRGRFHSPVSSADILTKFRERARSFGLTLTKEQCALKKDGTRFMFVANVENEARPDYVLQCGFRNSSDQSFAFAGSLGHQVTICENGLLTALVQPSRMRHTIGNVSEGMIDSRIDFVFDRFLQDKAAIHHQIDTMKGTPLTDSILGSFVRKANGEWRTRANGNSYFYKNPHLGSANLLRVLEELENPSLNDHDDSSCFRLLNAVTTVTTHHIKNPAQAASASRYCNNLIMSLIEPGFKPLGDEVEDAVDVE